MSVYIFTGPTLPQEAVMEVLPDATVLPPVAQGDVLRLMSRRPRVIGIIDGRFELAPAVWHKELLWAMTQGVHVFGSASMGALRAAELATFGMEGVGEIYDAVRRGEIVDDDEVAIAEVRTPGGWLSSSVAMVDIRATVALAVADGLIRPDTGELLLAAGKRAFYPDRVYPHILAGARESGADDEQLEALRAWLPAHRVDRKRADAMEMLQVIRARLAEGLPPKVVDYTVEPTETWRNALAQAGSMAAEASSESAIITERLLDELRLLGPTYISARREALLRYLSVYYAQQQGLEVDRQMLRDHAVRFREERNLNDQEANERWLAENDLDHAAFLQLIAGSALAEWTEHSTELNLSSYLLDYLRTEGHCRPLTERARHKRQVLQERSMESVTADDLGLTDRALLEWYVGEHLGLPVTDQPLAYQKLFGFAHPADFLRAVLHEYVFIQATSGARP